MLDCHMRVLGALLAASVLAVRHAPALLVATNLVKTVLKSGAFFFDKKSVNVLDNVTVTIRCGITTFVGPSGAGKSTLAKCIIGKEGLSSGSVTWNSDNSSSNAYECLISSNVMQKRSCYVDHLFSSSYNDKLCLHQLIPSVGYSVMIQEAAAALEIPSNEPVCGMLVSKRKGFEILLAMSKLDSLVQSSGAADPPTDLPTDPPTVVVLDEYLDKDMPSVRRSVCKGLRALAAHPSIRLHVILITHSKAALDECSDNVVCVKSGRIYHQGKFSRGISYPAQLQFIE